MTTSETHEILRRLMADYPAVVAAMLASFSDGSKLVEIAVDASVACLGHDEKSTEDNLASTLGYIVGLEGADVSLACWLSEEQKTRWCELFPEV